MQYDLDIKIIECRSDVPRRFKKVPEKEHGDLFILLYIEYSVKIGEGLEQKNVYLDL